MRYLRLSKESEKLYDAIEGRIEHLWGKLTTGNYNAATQVAFEVGCKSDIDDCLKKLRMKRTVRKVRTT